MQRGFITAAARIRADAFAIAAQSRHRSLGSVQKYVDAEARFDDHPGLKMFQRRSATLRVRYGYPRTAKIIEFTVVSSASKSVSNSSDQVLDPAGHGEPMRNAVTGATLPLIEGCHMIPFTAPDPESDWILSQDRLLKQAGQLNYHRL